ncbi:unnamed protein product [Arctia plantaginis]|uniref:Beta-1,4-N-acetylgalactosaminyltransferase n=1 Tax=Arctia plantaginis TaxID=874455 RepID=A0A8S1BAD9_ARCPL|nr:unnamed protein product [Arctia plantaginis]
MRHAFKKKILFCGIIVITLIILLIHPETKPPRTYEYIEKGNILSNLLEEVSENFSSTALIDCDYRDIIYDRTTLPISLMDGDLIEGHKIKEGGEYTPSDCKPKFSTAIIVPYRDKAEELRGFLVYMHTFFHRQHIHYRIYVIEQVDTQPFNRAKLMNIGAIAAIKAGYPCLILHDVDLLPLRPANLYACTKQPRHMSSSIDKYRFVLAHIKLYGGVTAIPSKQYKEVNGMSNDFYETGGEDDDLYCRLENHKLKMCQFDPDISQYHMWEHQKAIDTKQRKYPKFSKEKMLRDGLNSLKYTEVATVLHPLFTHIMVDL